MHPLITVIGIGIIPAVLTAVSIYFTVHARSLSLPTSPFAHFIAVVLPFTTYITLYASTRGQNPKTLLSRLRASLPTYTLHAILTVLFIIDTVLITLASASLSTEPLNCALERRWHALFNSKNENAVRAIQDALDCCGLRSTLDQAWPFPSHDVSAGTCVERFGRKKACETGWTGQGRQVLGSMVGVAVVVMVSKVFLLILMRIRPGWFRPESWTNGHIVRGTIMGGGEEEERAEERGRFLDQPEEHDNEVEEGVREGQNLFASS